MIAYKDAIRHHVCIGDKVLAPWQDDERYGPGTVLDGVDRRDLQPQGIKKNITSFVPHHIPSDCKFEQEMGLTFSHFND